MNMKQNLGSKLKVLLYIIPMLFELGLAQQCEVKCWIGGNCGLKRCSGCPFSCSGVCTIPMSRCEPWCILEDHCNVDKCSACLFCNANAGEEARASCPITTFEDRTDKVFSQSANYWSLWKHSGKPYFHEGAPLFVDIDGDGILDYVNSMHGHPIEHIGTRMELGLSTESPLDKNTFSLRAVSNRIIVEDDVEFLDTHAEVVADLDGDGINDLLISNGGGKGMIDDEDVEEDFDNLLFWGEEVTDETSGQKVTIFRGGRKAAREAGVEMRLGRGRFVYTVDMNGDGLLDLFSAQDRLVTNHIAPGILLINQGNRKWKKDPKMEEYTRAMILTDADGDGYANELVLNRGFCYPRRDGPDTDERFPELGGFTRNAGLFCNTRPVGTTAVYRYNTTSEQVEEISRPFKQFWDRKELQPPCCPHGLWGAENDCAAISIASGDFDDDDIADHIYLYRGKLVFYFSTDREEGDLTGNPQHMGLEIKLPEHCSSGESVRLVDFDNDGKEEMLVICGNAGIFLLYTQGSSKGEWSLSNDCNTFGSLGDINDRFPSSPTHQDLNEFCSNLAEKDWGMSMNVCNKYEKKSEIPAAKTSGASIVDLNNDGFQDIVVAHTFGYLRFFYNSPPPDKLTNRYIMLDLGGEGLIQNHGIGVTFVLYSTDDNGELVKQFREVASYHHAIDMAGARESRVIFGLGKTLTPSKLIVRFPNRTETEIDLKKWRFSNPILRINDIKESDLPTSEPISSENRTDFLETNEEKNIDLFVYSGASEIRKISNVVVCIVTFFAYLML